MQSIVLPNRPPLTAADPKVPGPQPDPGTSACPESESGEKFGRFNNVDVPYGIEIADGPRGRTRRVDVGVVTDRGCDRLRFYAIDPSRSAGPLVDITAADAPRVFPQRYVQPSPYQPGADTRGLHDNPLDDQSTAYGLALYRPGSGDRLRAFVTQRSRSNVAELRIVAANGGKNHLRARQPECRRSASRSRRRRSGYLLHGPTARLFDCVQSG